MTFIEKNQPFCHGQNLCPGQNGLDKSFVWAEGRGINPFNLVGKEMVASMKRMSLQGIPNF